MSGKKSQTKNLDKSSFKGLSAANKMENKDTINSIIKRSLTAKVEVNISDDEEAQEYVPTMKEKFLKN